MERKTVTTVRMNQIDLEEAIVEWVALHSVGEVAVNAKTVVFLDNHGKQIRYGMFATVTDEIITSVSPT